MADNIVIVNNLPLVPRQFEGDTEVWRFLNAMRDRVGGSSGALIYDAAQSSQQVSAIEPFLLGIKADLEQQLTGIALQIIEQVQQQNLDISSAFLEQQPAPPVQQEPPSDFNLAAVVSLANANAAVQSVFGRTGDIVAAEGDYSLTQLSDVTITAPAAAQGLIYNGATWVNSAITASAFSGTLPVANGGTGASTLTANNVILGNGTSPVQFVAPGSSGNVLTSNGTTWTSAAPAGGSTAPTYDRIVATAGQTVFNTANTVTANASGRSYTMVTKNGLVLSEGAGNDYTITGANQVTLTAGAALNDILTFRTWT